MKEHPDYKYRPRRKPKSLTKSPTQTGGHQTLPQKEHQNPQQSSNYGINSPLDMTVGMNHQRTQQFPMSSYHPLADYFDPAFTVDWHTRLQHLVQIRKLYPQLSYLNYPQVFSADMPQSPSPLSYVSMKPPKTSPSIESTTSTSNVI